MASVDRYHALEPVPMPFPAGMAVGLREVVREVTICPNPACEQFSHQLVLE